MKIKNCIQQLGCFGISAIIASSLHAQSLLTVSSDVSEANPGAEITRNALELSDMVATRPVDRDFINTALVLSDAGGKDSVTYCVAYNQQGKAIGRGFTKVAENGVSLVLASDLTHGRDFFGKISCKSRSKVTGTAYIIGPDFSDTRVSNLHDRAGSIISVPVAISR